MKRTKQVNGQRIVEIRRGYLIKRSDLNHAGVVDENVEAAELVNRFFHRCLDFMLPPNVTDHRQNLGARAGQFVGGPGQVLFIPRDQRNARAFRGKSPGEHQSKSARAARDQNGAALKREPPAFASQPNRRAAREPEYEPAQDSARFHC